MDSSPDIECHLNNLVGFLKRNNLVAPAVFMLELHKPFRGSLSLIYDCFGPLTNFFLSSSRQQICRYILEDPKNVEQIIQRLEAVE